MLVFGFLTAFIPGLAYVTIRADFLVAPLILKSVSYGAFEFSIHSATFKYLICTIGAILGLFYFSKNKWSPYALFTSMVLTTVGLIVPIYSTTISPPEYRFFDVQWIGSYIVLVGLSLIFLGSVLQKSNRHRTALLSVTFLFCLYAIYPFSSFSPIFYHGLYSGQMGLSITQ
jgi:hypothetical protein